MWFVIGLGNPGKEYEGTRHNAGFMALDALASLLDVSFSSQPKLEALIAKKGDIVLVKPQTFMNESGRAVRKTIAFYQKELLGSSELASLSLLHDDLDIRLGNEKWVFASGPKAHNGVNSVRQELGTDQFWYGRLGVDARTPEYCIEPHVYVLERFHRDEEPLMTAAVQKLSQKVYAHISS